MAASFFAQWGTQENKMVSTAVSEPFYFPAGFRKGEYGGVRLVVCGGVYREVWVMCLVFGIKV